MSPTLKRVLSVTTIILSGLVILLCAAGLIGAWASSGKIIAAGTTLIGAAQKGATALQVGLQSVDRRLKSLEEDTQTIQDATTQLSQNISDKGLVLVLLPPAKEEKLTNTVGAIKDALTTAEQTLSSLIDTLTFIDSLPLISVPKPDPDTVSAVAARVDKLNTTIDNTRARMQEARDNSAGAAQKISDATGEVNNAITEIRSELDARSQKLSATQDSLSSFAQSLPFWVYLGTLLVTLVLGWVIYTQVLIIQFALAKFKAA
jgi:septal ring factor EnvC (AmiA/AmiB activator)